MKFTYESIQSKVKENGWTLLSSTYKNQKTPLDFKCPNGHLISYTFEQWQRYKNKCPLCKQNRLYNTDVSVPQKKGTRVLGLDQSTNISGWAIFDDDDLIKFGIYRTTEKQSPLKIEQTKGWFAGLIQTWNPDFIVLEDIQLQKFNGGEQVVLYKTLAHLQGVLENYCVETNQKYTICPPSTWRSFSEIKGKSRSDKKKNAQLQIQGKYDLKVKEDEADAILIAKWGAEQQKKNRIVCF